MQSRAVAAGTADNVPGPQGIDELIQQIVEHVSVHPTLPSGPFKFAIDHCFAIRGQGTVMTGTVLSGSAKVGDSIELPELKVWLVSLMNSAFCMLSQVIANGLCCLMVLPMSLVVSTDCQRPFLDSRCRPQTSVALSLLAMTMHFASSLLSCTVDIVWQASGSMRSEMHAGLERRFSFCAALCRGGSTSTGVNNMNAD